LYGFPYWSYAYTDKRCPEVPVSIFVAEPAIVSSPNENEDIVGAVTTVTVFVAACAVALSITNKFTASPTARFSAPLIVLM
jgi:hypothetical protein